MERHDLAARLGAAVTAGAQPVHAIEERDPARFMKAFARAVGQGGNIFLTDPSWKAAERAALARIAACGPEGDSGWLMIPSGGSSGGLKFARHDSRSIVAAVDGFRAHFGIDRVNSVGVLPLHHVSGFMAWMRSVCSGGEYVPWAWKDVEAGNLPGHLPPDCCLSLVPTQLQRLLKSPGAVAWLRRFRAIFLGGAPSWMSMLDEASRLELPISLGFGATETAAMAAAMTPEQFLGGARGCGRPLPHVRIEIVDDGVRISGRSVFRGYFPDLRQDQVWDTGDLGRLEADGSLVILGRADDVIMSGGKKVWPLEVEQALRASGEFEDVAVVGLPDPDWGQIVVACHPRASHTPRRELVDAALSGLATYKHPKRYLPIEAWPRSAHGKISRRELVRIVSES